MGTSRLFMPLLAELGGLGDGFCYKYVAPNGAPPLERRLFNKAIRNLCSVNIVRHVQAMVATTTDGQCTIEWFRRDLP